MKNLTLTATSALVAACALAAPALAAPAVGLVGDRTLVSFDTDAPAIGAAVEIATTARVLGIDLRPATGQVIGVTDAQEIIEIDPATGAVTLLSTMNTALPLMADQPVIVDFNPAADRLRLMTGTTNHRVNVDTGEVTVDGALAYLPGDANAGVAPMIAAAAYINSYGTPEATAMFNIDAGFSALVQQTVPNDGTLATIGGLGVMLDGDVALDVATTPEGANTVWLAALNGLHTVDLATGAVTGSMMIEGLDGNLRDIAILPAM